MQGSTLTYTERAAHCPSTLAAEFLRLLDAKQTNLALSADVTSAQELLHLADTLGPEICLLKTHIDIIRDFSPELTLELTKLAKRHQFMIFEDRKFADIGNTVKQQYAGGIYQIADWADMVNAHVLPGPGIISGLAEIGKTKHRGLILLAEMSSSGHLMGAEYIQQTLKMAEEFPDFVLGFITQHVVSADPQWINFTPGVQITADGDGLGQRYVTPEQAIANGSDVIIVGRGIIKAADQVLEASKYRKLGWEGYSERVNRG